MTAEVYIGFSLKIKGFYKHYQDRPRQTQDELIKELKETFTKAFAPPNQSNFVLIKEVLSDEVILNDQLTLDQCQEVIRFITENEKFKKLGVATGQE